MQLIGVIKTVFSGPTATPAAILIYLTLQEHIAVGAEDGDGG